MVQGQHFRLLCLTGEAKGTSYFLTGARVVMGRSETADIKVMDVKSSREHAEVIKFKDHYVVTDLGSQNGIMVNDLKVNQHRLSDGDKIIIGSTVYAFKEFIVGDKPGKSDKKVTKNDEDDDEVIEAPKKKSKMLPILAVLALLAFMLLSGDEESEKDSKESKSKKGVTDTYIELAQKKNQDDDAEVQRKLDTIIQRGQREFREGNFFRAIEEFNLALVLSPNNGRASFYLNKTKQSLDNHIEDLFLKSRREYDSLKYAAAGQTYCSIIKMLQNYPDDERYKQAQNQVKNVEKALGMYDGEFKCFEE